MKTEKKACFLSFLIPKLSENENSWVFGFSFRCVRNGLRNGLNLQQAENFRNNDQSWKELSGTLIHYISIDCS